MDCDEFIISICDQMSLTAWLCSHRGVNRHDLKMNSADSSNPGSLRLYRCMYFTMTQVWGDHISSRDRSTIAYLSVYLVTWSRLMSYVISQMYR